MYKKIVILLALLLFVPPPTGFAAEDAAQIGDQVYATLSEAIAAAQPGDTITLRADCTLDEPLTISQAVSLDGAQHTLSLSSTASITICDDFSARNLQLECVRSSNSDAPIVLSGSQIACSLERVTVHCPSARRAPQYPSLLVCSATDSTLSLQDCRLTSALNQTSALLLTGDCTGTDIRLSATAIEIAPDSGTARSCFGIQAASSGSATLTLQDCAIDAPTAALATADSQDELSAVLDDCDLSAPNPLYLAGTDSSFALQDCALTDTDDAFRDTAALIVLSTTASDNTVSLADSQLTSAASACIFSLQNLDNQASLDGDSAVTVASGAPDLTQLHDTLLDQPWLSVGRSVDLSDFPVAWQQADGRLCNATSDLAAAAQHWQAGDTVTLRGALAGALDLQVPLTIQGEEAQFSGSLAIRHPGIAVHGVDLSRSAVDCTPGCDLSHNYWGAQSFPADAVISPYYTDPGLEDLAYAPVSDGQTADELRAFTTQVADILTQALPGSSLERFAPQTAGDALTPFAQTLRALCDRLSQSTTAAQRADLLAADPDLAAQMRRAWTVYWAGVGASLADSVVAVDPLVPLDPVLHALLTENPSANQPATALQADGTQVSPDQPIRLHSLVQACTLDAQNRVQSLTFTSGLQTTDGTPVAGDATYRLPLPSRSYSSVTATVDGQPVAVSPSDGDTVTLSQCGTVVLTLTYPTDPDAPIQPTPPDEPAEPDEARYTVALRAGSHGTLRLRTASEAAADTVVRISVLPDDGYAVDSVDVLDTRGRAIDHSLEDQSLRFVLPACDVRVTARFAPIADDLPLPAADAADLAADAWYQSDVQTVLQAGWMTPLLEGVFAPELSTARGDLIAALHRMSGSPAAQAPAFADIPPDSAYYAASVWARAAGIAVGEPDGRFRPYDPITREECIALLYRACGAPNAGVFPLPFADEASISPWARPALCWAYQTGLLSGNAEGTCTPQAAVTRAETAALLVRLSHC